MFKEIVTILLGKVKKFTCKLTLFFADSELRDIIFSPKTYSSWVLDEH